MATPDRHHPGIRTSAARVAAQPRPASGRRGVLGGRDARCDRRGQGGGLGGRPTQWAELWLHHGAATHEPPGVVAEFLKPGHSGGRRGRGEPDDAALEHWGRLQVQATLERVRSASLTVAWLEGHGVSRQRLNQWRRRGRLIAVADVPASRASPTRAGSSPTRLRPKPWVADSSVPPRRRAWTRWRCTCS